MKVTTLSEATTDFESELITEQLQRCSVISAHIVEHGAIACHMKIGASRIFTTYVTDLRLAPDGDDQLEVLAVLKSTSTIASPERERHLTLNREMLELLYTEALAIQAAPEEYSWAVTIQTTA